MASEFDPNQGGEQGRFSSRISETAEVARNKAEHVASATAARAREMTASVGHKVRELAGRIRQRPPHESARNATEKVADQLDRAGTYLEEKSFEGIAEDLTGIIRRYPIQSVLIGVGVGFLLSRRRDRY